MNGNDLPELVAGYAELPEGANDCGCSEGLDLRSPLRLYNRPALPAIAYRVGTHADFKRSMLARLSSDELPALADLKTRDDDDFSIALIDAWASVCDVLSFYQERIANEAYLGTSTERLSLVELGRLIGYRLKPGVAAATDLVFLMEEPPGAPAQAVAETAIVTGSRVQSIPGPDEKAQIFETVEDLTARVAWNALSPRRSEMIMPGEGDRTTVLAGIDLGLKVGDAILVVGHNRAVEDSTSELWDFRRLTRVEIDSAAGLTFIEWDGALAAIDPAAQPAPQDRRLYVMRKRVSLFGHNAPTPKLLPRRTRVQFGFPNNDNVVSDWSFTVDTTNQTIHLDALYPEIVADSWVVLARSTVKELYRVTQALDDGRSDYAISGRSTRVSLDGENLTFFDGSAYRRTSVYGQSEALTVAETPLLKPVMGDTVELAGLTTLEEGRRLLLRGRRAQVRVATDAVDVHSDSGASNTYSRGTRLMLMEQAAPVAPASTTLIWHLVAPGGFTGYTTAQATAFDYVAADTKIEIIAEPATLDAVESADETHARLRLTSPLAAAFDRPSTVVHANVAAATHGESTEEILGDGDASRPFQSFALKQTPITHVSAATESGTESTLELRIDDVRWHEVPYLYGRGPRERVYTTRRTDAGETIVQFGDGAQGARPPSGRNNVVAGYRLGLGRQGSLDAGTLSLPLDKPLGLKDVSNPVSAAGGDDPESAADARENAPVTTLTLGRVVSLKDYGDFACGFAGIARAHASWTWDGDSRRIVVTVAGPGGEPVDPATGDTFDNLVSALRQLGDPFVRVDVKTYRPATFRLKLGVKVYPDHLPEVVLANVETRLRAAYGFETRGFARLVSLSEMVMIVHEVAGVEAVDVDRLYRTTPPNTAPILHHRLLALPPTLEPTGDLSPAEILTLDPGPLDALEVL